MAKWDISCTNALLDNNLASMHRQKCLPGSFQIHIGGCKTPVQSKNEKSCFKKAGLLQATDLLTVVSTTEIEIALHPPSELSYSPHSTWGHQNLLYAKRPGRVTPTQIRW